MRFPLVSLFVQDHYRLVIVPRGHPSAKNILSDRDYRSLPIEEKLARVRHDIARANILKEVQISGFHSATAALLSTMYAACLGDTEVFAFRCYPWICAYVFVPAQRLSEQVGYSPLTRGQKMDFLSTLGHIDYNIRANWLYGSARILGRKRYLEYCFAPLFSEIFKGLEFLARLYFLSLETRSPGRRFKGFLQVFSGLDESQIEALWQFRCGIVHSNSLYNSTKNQIWRFGVRTQPNKNPTVLVEDDLVQSLEGKHFTIHTEGMIDLYRKAKVFVLQDMLANYGRYLTNPDFFAWLRGYLSVQYLPSQKEMKRIYIEAGGSEDTFERELDLRPHFGLAKVPVSRFYLFKLSLPSKLGDLKTRFRNLFRRF